MIRVLWLCNCPLGNEDSVSTGSWLSAMARGLIGSGEIELGIISAGPVKQVTRNDYGQVKQWVVPDGAPRRGDGLPSCRVVQAIVEAAKAFCPDLIHVWGTEGYWGLLTARQLLRHPTLLDIQGLKHTIAGVYYGGLSLAERLRCIGIKEVLKRRTMYHERRAFKQWGAREREMIQGLRFIGSQCPWVTSKIRAIHPQVRLFTTDLALRADFESALLWKWTNQPVVFTSSAYPAPFKGLHVAIRAVAALRKRCPDARLRVAGPYQRVGIRQEGYVRWLNALVCEVGMEGHVDWLGNLTAAQIVQELQLVGVALIPSFVESYCLGMAEAMQVGTPIVSAFIGGTSYLGRDEESCLFFPPGDAAMCAYQLERVLTERELAGRLSQQARETAARRHDRQQLVARQLETYRQVLRESAKSGVAGPP